MTTKYVTVPTAYDSSPNDWQRSHIRERTIVVHEMDMHRRDTGLLDSRGNKIMAVEQTNPIGFGR